MARQVDIGTIIGYQGNESDPTFWISRPPLEAVEYWVLYKPEETNGFKRPGDDHPELDWRLESASVEFHDPEELAAWICSEWGLLRTELEVMQHDKQLVPPPNN